jgi:phosphoribosyl-ATP pyrophosphohydrolase
MPGEMMTKLQAIVQDRQVNPQEGSYTNQLLDAGMPRIAQKVGEEGVEETSGYVDRASAALIKDLKERGLFDSTLIIWGGEFGRTPMAQGAGRDHHIKGFSMWLAGGGVRGGTSYGATDDLGYNAVDNIVHVHDLHATMLHLLGVDHTKLTYRFQGRDFRLTDVAGHVVKDVLT